MVSSDSLSWIHVLCSQTSLAKDLNNWGSAFLWCYSIIKYNKINHCLRENLSSFSPHPRNNRSSSWDGQKRTSVSSRIWFCRPSSPSGPCTFFQWGWQRGRCLCCGRMTPHGHAGQTPPCGSAGSASLDGPVKKTQTLRQCCFLKFWK